MKTWRIGSAARPSPAAKGRKTSAGEHCCGRAAPRPPLHGRAEEQPSSAAPAAASKTRTQAGTVQRVATAAACAKSREKSRRAWKSALICGGSAGASPGLCWSFPQPPRAGNGPCGPPAVSRGCPLRERRLRSSGGKEPSRPTRRQVEAAPVTLPDGRLGPSSLTIHARLSGRPQAAVTAATVPLAQYSASSNPAACSTVLHSQSAWHGCVVLPGKGAQSQKDD